MPKIVPPQSPEYCWAIAEASYKEGLQGSNGFLRKYFPDATTLAEESIRGWRFILVKKGDQLSVAFRGTDKWHNWLGNLWHELVGAYSDTANRMEKIIERWESAYGKKIDLFSSHSGGATWAASVKKTDQVARVFFNSHKAWNNDSHWHLTTQDDMLARLGLVVSGDPRREINKYMVIGPGSHSLNAFETLVKQRNWNQLQQEAQQYFPDEMASLAHTQRLSQESAMKLESGEILLSPKNIKALQTNLTAKNELLKKAEESVEFLQNFSQATKMMASRIYEHLDQSQQEKGRFWDLQQQNNDLVQRGEEAAAIVERRSTASSYGALAYLIHHQFHPQHALHLADEIRDLTKHYESQVNHVIADLGNVRDVDAALQAQFTQLDRMDQSQQKIYRDLLKTQKKIGEKFRKLETICTGIRFICSVVPGCHPIAKLTASAATGILQLAYLRKQGQGNQAIRKQSVNLQKITTTKERLADMAQKNQTGHDILLQHSVSVLNSLSSDHTKFIPADHRQSLSILIGNLDQEVQMADASICKTEQDLQELNTTIDAAEGKLAWIQRAKWKKKKDEKKALEREECKLSAECAAKKARRLELTENLKAQKKDRNILQEQIESAKAAQEEALCYANLRNHIWEVISTENQWMCANNERAKKLTQEVSHNFSQYNQVRAQNREMAHAFLNKAHKIALECGYRGDSIEVFALSYELWDQLLYWKDIALPNAQAAVAQYNKDPSKLVVENMGVCVAQYLIPAAGVFLTGIQLFRTVRGLIAEAPQKQKSIHQIMLEEISQQLHLLNEELQKAVAKKIKNLEEAITKKIEEIGESIVLSTESLRDQIADFRRENTDQHEKTNLNLYLKDIENRSIFIKTTYNREIEKFDNLYHHYYTRYFHLITVHNQTQTMFLAENNEQCVKEFTDNLRLVLEMMQTDLDQISSSHDRIRFSTVNSLVGSKDEHIPTPSITKVLASEISAEEALPNWQLLVDLSERFITLARTIAKRELFNKTIHENESLKKVFSRLCLEFPTFYDKIGWLRAQIKPLIERIHKQQNSIVKANAAKILASSEARSAYLLLRSKMAISQFDWDSLLKKLVAEEKFALHTGLISLFSYQLYVLSQIQESRYLNRYKTAHTISITIASIMTFGIARWLLDEKTIRERFFLRRWIPIWAKVGTPEDLLTVNSKSLSIDPTIKCYEGRAEGNTQNQQISKDLYQSRRKALGIDDYQLIFDLRTRQVRWIATEAARNHIVLLKIAVSSSNLTLLEHSPSSFCNSINLEKIRESQGEDKKNYRKSLINLIKNYKTILNNIIEGTPINNNDALAPLANGEIILNSSKNGMPLIFPKTLLRQLEMLLDPIFRHTQALEQGIFIPYYEFSTDTRELTIHYDLISHPLTKKPYKFAKFTVAIFDVLTIQSFRPDLTSDAVEFDSTELLIQAMYGKFATEALGLPGKNSFVFPELRQIVPCEISFEGLYSLWEKHPNKVINYNSQTIDDPLEKNLLVENPIVLQASEDYVYVVSSIQKQKSLLTQKKQEHEKLFNLLTMIICLFSNLKREFILKKLMTDFGIFPPDLFDIMYDLTALDPLSEQQIQLFIQELSVSPNPHVSKLAILQEQMYNINDWIMGHSDGLTAVDTHSLNAKNSANFDEFIHILASLLEKSVDQGIKVEHEAFK